MVPVRRVFRDLDGRLGTVLLRPDVRIRRVHATRSTPSCRSVSRVEPPLWLERRASYIKYGLLVAVVGYYIATKQTSVYRYVEPFWMFTRSANALLWTMLAVLLIATIVVRNVYCRFLCPVGAMLGIISQVTTVLPIKRWSECKTCKICERACEWGAIQGPKIIKSECVRCDDCERIYADKKACVHWLMIVKKERWAREGIKGTA